VGQPKYCFIDETGWTSPRAPDTESPSGSGPRCEVSSVTADSLASLFIYI